jgi:two-component system, chemotaxis family, response regulator Rcp1
MAEQVLKVLWVEDNIGDILLIKEAFEQAGLNYRLNVVNNGVDAMTFLTRTGRYTKATLPDLMILDLNLPKKSGREVIADIKENPSLASIPVVVLTTSSHDQDVLTGLDPKRCIYLVKPSSFNALVEMAKQIQTFWNSLPSAQNQS